MTTTQQRYNLAIIGAGPGGYVAAIRAAQLGLSVALIEKDEVGGLCLNWGCIPSKALLRNAEVVSLFHSAREFGVAFTDLTVDFGAAIERSRRVVNRLTRGIAYLLRKNGVARVNGEASFVDANTLRIAPDDTLVRADNIIIATGAHSRSLPVLPLNGDTIISSREALEQKQLPASVAIIGGGAIGVEFATIYNSYGVNVTIVEMMPHLLPNEDAEIADTLQKSLARRGVNVLTNARAEEFIEEEDGRCILRARQGENVTDIRCEKALVAVGIEGNVESLGLDAIGVANEAGFITVDDGLATSVAGVFAIGDVTGKLPLAHVASAQGVYVAERLAGNEPPTLNYVDMPRATFSNPQVASLGLSEGQAREQGHNVKIGRFPFQASGMAAARGSTEGMVKLVVDSAYGEILGAHMVGSDVTELLSEVSVTRMLEGGMLELGWMTHAHPTVSEAIKEAALNAAGAGIHA